MNNDVFNERGIITNIDYCKRKPNEWAKIYNIKLVTKIDGIWSEYEWAWNMLHELQYYSLPDMNMTGNVIDFSSFEKATEMGNRANSLCMDLYNNATSGERYKLDSDNKFFVTEWVKNQLKVR
jgi:hypothetical protein